MMNMTTTMILKASVYTPKASFFLYNNRPSLMNVSVQIPYRLQQHPVGPLRLSSAVLPILNKQHVATRASFQCRYAKDKTTAQTEPVNDSRLWIHALKWLTRSVFWIFYFCSMWMLPKFFIITSAVLLLTFTIFHLSKKTEPDNVTFDDLVGVEGPKDILRKLVHVHGKVISRDCEVRLICPVLLYGPPGTGKSTLVHALAREAKAPFFSVSAHEIAKAGLYAINFLFIEARIFSRSIIYIKDVDVIASHKRILVKLHREMEKCSKDGRVLVIVSTNKPETEHPAFMRFPYLKIHVGKPNTDSRRTVIGLHLSECLRDEDKEAICDLFASQTPGFVWADLEKTAYKARRLAAIRGDDHVTMDVVLKAVGVVKPYICCDENEATVQA